MFPGSQVDYRKNDLTNGDLSSGTSCNLRPVNIESNWTSRVLVMELGTLTAMQISAYRFELPRQCAGWVGGVEKSAICGLLVA